MKEGCWNCTSVGPQNNGLVQKCEFSFEFPGIEIGNPHCPICSSLLQWKSAGPSVSEFLRRGAKKA